MNQNHESLGKYAQPFSEYGKGFQSNKQLVSPKEKLFSVERKNSFIIEESKKQVRLKLNSEFYPKEDLFIAEQDFTELCEVIVKDDEVVLKQKDFSISLEDLGREFCNYVLGLRANRLGI